MRSISIVVMTVIMVMPAAADERPVRLKPATGLDKVEANCAACHSVDYIPMNSPFLNAAGWDAEVAKMINTFGAAIDQADAKVIADYLKENYGMPVVTPRVGVPIPTPRPAPRLISGAGWKRSHFRTIPLWHWKFGPLWRWKR